MAKKTFVSTTKKATMTERKFCSRKEYKKLIPQLNCAIEVKIINLDKKKSISFNCIDKTSARRKIKDTQRQNLWEVVNNGLFIPIPDCGFKTVTRKFDSCYLKKGAKAFVNVIVYEKNKKELGYFIKIQDWEKMERETTRKSATEEMLKKYATYIANYKTKEIIKNMDLRYTSKRIPRCKKCEQYVIGNGKNFPYQCGCPELAVSQEKMAEIMMDYKKKLKSC